MPPSIETDDPLAAGTSTVAVLFGGIVTRRSRPPFWLLAQLAATSPRIVAIDP